MNNKFIKRVAAVVLGVAVLSTCAFAATISDGSTYSSGTLTFGYTTTGEKVSYIAYAAEASTDGYTLGNIVAVNQIDNSAESVANNSVTISSTLLGDAGYIVLQSGDDQGVYTQVAIPTSDYAIKSTSRVNNNNSVTVEVGGEKVTFTVTNGIDGASAQTPHIGENGNWYIGDTDTGVKAKVSEGALIAIGVVAGVALAGTCAMFVWIMIERKKNREKTS